MLRISIEINTEIGATSRWIFNGTVFRFHGVKHRSLKEQDPVRIERIGFYLAVVRPAWPTERNKPLKRSVNCEHFLHIVYDS